MMGVSQQTAAACEVGRRGVPVSSVPALARALDSTVRALFGENIGPVKRGPEPKLQRQIERITQVPKPKQRFVMQVLESALAQVGSRWQRKQAA